MRLILLLALCTLGFAQNDAPAQVDPFGDGKSPVAAPIYSSAVSSVAASSAATSSASRSMPEVTDPEILKKFQNLNQEMGTPELQAPPTEQRSLGGFAVQMFFALLLVVFLIWLSVWGLKKMQKSRFNMSGMDNGMQIVEQIYMGPQQRVVVVRIHDRVLALGVTQHNVNFLADLSSEEAYQGNEASAKQFGKSVDYFLRHFKKGSTPPPIPEGDDK